MCWVALAVLSLPGAALLLPLPVALLLLPVAPFRVEVVIQQSRPAWLAVELLSESQQKCTTTRAVDRVWSREEVELVYHRFSITNQLEPVTL